MGTKVQRDENIAEMTKDGGTVLHYTEGYSEKYASYIAVGIVEEKGEYLFYSLIQPLEYDRIKNEDTRWVGAEWSHGYESFDEVKAEYDEYAKRITGSMTRADSEYEIECAVRYRGIQVTRDGYNW